MNHLFFKRVYSIYAFVAKFNHVYNFVVPREFEGGLSWASACGAPRHQYFGSAQLYQNPHTVGITVRSIKVISFLVFHFSIFLLKPL